MNLYSSTLELFTIKFGIWLWGFVAYSLLHAGIDSNGKPIEGG